MPAESRGARYSLHSILQISHERSSVVNANLYLSSSARVHGTCMESMPAVRMEPIHDTLASPSMQSRYKAEGMLCALQVDVEVRDSALVPQIGLQRPELAETRACRACKFTWIAISTQYVLIQFFLTILNCSITVCCTGPLYVCCTSNRWKRLAQIRRTCSIFSNSLLLPYL